MAVHNLAAQRFVDGDVLTLIEEAPPGPILLRLVGGRTRVVSRVLGCLQGEGYVPVHLRDRAHREPGALPLHHHVALVVGHHAAGPRAAASVKRLAAASPRRHVVVCVAPDSWEPPFPSAYGAFDDRGTECPVPEPAPPTTGDVRRLVMLMMGGHVERARAWLSALEVAAELEGAPLPDDVLRLATWLHVWRCRPEEADAAASRVVHGPSRRLLSAVACCAASRRIAAHRPSAGSSGVTMPAWTHGASVMFLLSAIPALLRRLAEADDELCALRAAGTWAVEHAGCRGVAFLGVGDSRVAVVAGWGGRGPSESDRLFASRADAAARCDQLGTTLAVSPIREVGARIGAVLVVGPSENGGTLAEAATTLAVLCASPMRLRIDHVAAQRRGRELLPELIGESPAAVAVRDAVAKAASTPFPVLVEGESGTGKELVARALHRLSARRERRFVAVNCAAISDDLIETELFGHSRGAFTGAVGPRVGLFEDAHGGTLFLDEVSELSPRAQAKLLRALQEREVRRVGENQARPIDVRIIAATNRALVDACEAGEFRDDLRFRLAVVRIRLSPLRERAEDVAPLARTFWARTMKDVGKHAVLGVDALARLAAHGWAGNVRELQNVVAGLALVAPERGRVRARHVDLVLTTSGASRQVPPMSLERARRVCEQQTVAAALARHAGRRSAAARELGITRQGLAKILRRIHGAAAASEGVA